jgi:predicted DNA-binding transcriptional regulator YafY
MNGSKAQDGGWSMTGWQDWVSVGERRSAALLALLVNARRPIPVDDVFTRLPEYPGDPAQARLGLDDDVARLRSFGLDITWDGPSAPSIGIGAAGWQHRPVRLTEKDLDLLDQVEALTKPLDESAARALSALRGEALPAERDTTISLSPRGSAARGRPVAYSRLHRLVWLAERGVTAGFGYRDASGEFVPRRLQVAGLGESRGVWYAVGFEPGSHTMRAFAVSEMRGPVEAVDAPGSYELPFGMDVSEYLSMPWRLGPDPVPARVLFDAEISAFIGSMLVHLPLEPRPDGSLEATVAVGDLDAFVGWVLSYGTHAKILEPAEAVTRAREILAKVVAAHE